MPTLDWIGKQAVVRHHAEVPFHLLKEEPELSCGGEAGAGNLIVQGDNLKALKALLPHYGGQVKCIYIDPPYNTGNEGWVYNDNVNSPEIKRWLESVVGKEGEDLTRHDKWLCMMYPRLMLLKRFLREDGVILVSIDDNEIANLRPLMDEIFGAQNFVEQLIWKKSYGGGAKERFVVRQHEYCLFYALDKRRLNDLWLPPDEGAEDRYYKFKDHRVATRGPYRVKPLEATKSMDRRDNLVYPIPAPDGTEIMPRRQWWWSRERAYAALQNDELVFLKGKDGWSVSYKQYLRNEEGEQRGAKPFSIIDGIYTQAGTADVRELFEDRVVFQFTKPSALVQRLLQMIADKDSLILDSFAGSGTTGHAVLKQNAEDGGNRRFILVEMDESIAHNITAERVRRVSQGYKNAKGEVVAGLGSGFRFAKLGKTLFDESGAIREDVKFRELAEFVYFHHTGSPMPKGWKTSPLLGIVDGRAIYLLYNGILGDRSIDGGNVLTAPVLAELPPHNGPKTIYAAACRLGPNRLERERIQFKQTPYGLRVD